MSTSPASTALPLVLCVDDDSTVLEAQRVGLRELLRGRAVLEQCSNALEAEELAHEALEDGLQIAVLVTDEIMPDRRGHQLLSSMVSVFPRLRAVMLTGQAGAEDVGAAVNTGALHGFVNKPWDRQELQLAVERALEHWEDADRLSRAQRRQDFLLEGDPAAVIMVDERDHPVAWNAAASTILPSLQRGRPVPVGSAVDLARLRAAAGAGASQAATQLTDEFGGNRKDGARVHAHRVYGPGPDGLWVYRRSDVTETVRVREALERTRAEFAEQQRLEALGLMMGSLVHDFGNVLMVLTNSAEFLLESTDPESELGEEAAVVAESVEHAQKLVQEVLGFARRTTPSVAAFSLSEALRAIFRMLRRLPGADNRLAFVAPPVDHQVRMIHSHLEQIVLNLVKNALECGPEVTVTLRVTDEQPPHLLVADDGPGIEAAAVARVFEPFFTTKGEQSGTGLGLATCLRLAEQAGCTLAVRETGPEGTTFALSLPVVAAPGAEGPAAPSG